jgi:glycosyltransferase involved in cell wall biosynthesis
MLGRAWLDGADDEAAMERGEVPQLREVANRSRVMISANSFWNIKNFRSGLVDALASHGYELVIAAPGVDREWAGRRGVQSIEVRVDRSGINPFRDVALLATYHRLILRFRPKFFLGFTAKPNIYGSIAARYSGATFLPNVSGLGTAFINPGPLSALVGLLYRVAFAHCPIVFFQNQDDCDLFVRRKIVRSEQVRLLPGSGVDLDHFKPAPSEASSAIHFLFVGRLLGDKGVREFVEAARLLRPSHANWTFQLLGPIDEGNRSGIGRDELDRWVRDGTVEYLGQAEDVRPHIGASTAVVLPSYREGLPRSLLEAAAMARPLIATDVPGNRRIVEHGLNGLLCEARDPTSLADAMQEIGLMDAAKREAMGNAARNRVESGFGERLVIQAYLDAIAQLQDGGRS